MRQTTHLQGMATLAVLIAALAPLGLARGEAPAFAPGSVVRFNLDCAHCHEGQCSGRLSFALGVEATYGHIRRYAPDALDREAMELHQILGYMKENCAYAPLPGAAPVPLDDAALAAYRDPESGNLFVPLGRVDQGRYRLALALAQPAALHIELIDENFEHLLDRCVETDSVAEPIEVETAGALFLRLRGSEGLAVRSLRLDRQGLTQ
ncbi:MAG: hypothetical protein MUC77_06425 [Chromatiaceae bacterium]|nr:hypothetical protein [Chromatiaceae bacterium]